MEFKGQVALITGGSRGIGRAIALALAKGGCDIALHYCSARNEAEAVAEQIKELGRRVELFQADLSCPSVCEPLVCNVVETFTRLDILVNNAGITRDDLLVSLSLEKIEAVLNTNLLAPILLTRSAAMTMIRQRYGRIVNISSSAASKPCRGQSNYVAAKGGLEAFTKAMAVELAPRNIMANAVAPGVIQTDMSEQIRALGEKEILARLLLKRFAKPEEVAEIVVFLASPRNQYMTGEVIHLDGGLKMA